MPPAVTLERSLWTLNVLASILVVWRLYSIHVHHRYRFFFASMLLALARSAALFPFDPKTETYYRIWASTQPLVWLFYVLVISELYSLVLRQYRGIYSLSRWFFFGATAASVVISALTVIPTIATTPHRRWLLYSYVLVERELVTSLAVFLLLLLALVAWFPVPLSRNLLTHCCVYSAYFFAGNVVFLYWHVGGIAATRLSSIAKLSIALICLFCWVFLLSSAAEKRSAVVFLGRNPLEEKRLLDYLESLNATLLRTAGK